MKVPEFDKHLKKAGGHIGRNVVKMKKKEKDDSPKTLNDKNHQASSQKYRQLMPYWVVFHLFLGKQLENNTFYSGIGKSQNSQKYCKPFL